MKRYFFLLFVSAVYLFFRLGWQDTIQFGYDQPRLAFTIAEYLTKGNYLTSQNFVLKTPWGNISWGPSLVFFFASILAISKDPLTISIIVAVLNLISVIVIFYIGWHFFSPRVGIVAGLILAVHPWWIIFSRMFYQPSFVPSLISISMLLSFLVLKSSKKIFASFLIFSWAVIVQFYLSTLSFIVTSFVFLFDILRKLSFRWIFLGILLTGLVFIPTFYFFKNNFNEVGIFFESITKFKSTTKDVFINYFKTTSGGNFEWELGYGYEDFVKENFWVEKIFTINFLLILMVIVYSFFVLLNKSNNKIFRFLLFFWCIGPLWFLSLVKVEYVVPRYFLISLPSLSLLVGLFVDDISKKIKYISLLIPIFLIFSWSLLIVRYYNFLENYSYPNGFLSHFSDIPYSFLRDAFSYMRPNKPAPGLWAVNYYLYYVDKNPGGRVLYEISFDKPDPKKKIIARFGPYTLYKIEKLEANPAEFINPNNSPGIN